MFAPFASSAQGWEQFGAQFRPSCARPAVRRIGRREGNRMMMAISSIVFVLLFILGWYLIGRYVVTRNTKHGHRR